MKHQRWEKPHAFRPSFQRHTFAFVLLLVGLGFVLTPEPSKACSCAMVSTADAFESSSAVFLGTVASIRYHESGTGAVVGETAAFEVEMVWKGPVSETIYVAPSSYNSSCGFGFTQGAKYLVYAEGLGVSACSRTTWASLATEDLAILGEGQVPKPGTVSPASFGAGEQLITKAWADPTPPASEAQAGNAADPTPSASVQKATVQPDPTPSASAQKTTVQPDPTPSASAQNATAQPDPTPPPSEPQTSSGCSRSPNTIGVSVVGALVGLAWFGVRTRRGVAG